MKPSPITQLRDVVPLRPLTRIEAHAIAEKQALKLLALLGHTQPPVPDALIADLPRIEVAHRSPWPTSGATQWVGGRWLVIVNGSEPLGRQRFSLAHELKHIIDHRFIDIIYARWPTDTRQACIEATCDYFAGCLLMPRPWVKHAWTTGNQRLDRLARLFGVSHAAIATRLRQLGLTEPTHRCANTRDLSAIRNAIERTGWDYQRAPALGFATTATELAA